MARIAERAIVCAWCDELATYNLDTYYDVACEAHYLRWFAAEWERELLAIPPSCVCDWLVDGERVMVCRVHDPDS